MTLVGIASLLSVGSIFDARGGASEGRLPFFTVIGCDEPVEVGGTFHPVVHSTSNAKTFHFLFHIDAHGEGTGLVSGAKYIWNDTIIDRFKGGAGATIQRSYGNLRVRSTDPALSDLRVNLNVQFVVSATGELVVEKFEFTSVCE